MKKRKDNSFFEAWTRKGTKEEEDSYEKGMIGCGIIGIIFMLMVLIAVLIQLYG